MRIHAINTATIRVKNHYVAASGGLRALRLTSSLVDTRWREIPVYAWAIEHPEGVIVIDTGESARVHDPNYFPAWQRPYWLSQYEFNVTSQTEIGAQLRARGIPPEEVRWVILTHGHFDHTDALYHFPNAEFVMSRKELDDVERWRSAHFAFPSRWPDWVKPRAIEYVPEAIGPFPESFPLTRMGDLWLVPTPGHTPGHQSVILRDGWQTIFFAGDASFDQYSLLHNVMDAPAVDQFQARETRLRILDYAEATPLVYLTTHDWETEKRLEARVPLFERRRVVVPV
jgi:glyoxylase-like metal-dependent hydrolase (beta-lactamase superfamily II)